MATLCLLLAGCAQTPKGEQPYAKQIEEGKALRAELESGCAAQGFTPGTPEFQSCVGRASIPHANAGVSDAKMIHQGVKHGAATIETANAAMRIGRVIGVVSDSRLKEDLLPVGVLANGLHLYRFRYKGDPRRFVGVLAQEVLGVAPGAVQAGADGFLRVDYQQLGIEMMTWEAWQRRQAAVRWHAGRF
jgi:hypothetical protein